MKNAMQLKAIMKKLAKENQISAQLVLQNYMLERFLERVSLSPYRDNYIINFLYGGAELQSDNGYGCNHKGLSSYAGCRPKNDRADSHRSC